MPEVTIEQAIALLQANGGYEWLVNGAEMWSAPDVADRLNNMGISVHRATVLRWLKAMKHQDFGALGVYATRTDLILFFAGRLRGGTQYDADQPDDHATSGM